MKNPLLVLSLAAMATAASAETRPCAQLLDHDMRRLASDETVHLCDAYQGQVILIVNTASRCGFTPQYEGLEALYRTYRDRGLVVLGFPSNDFMNQEPGTEEEISEFCRLTYSIEFPMFERVQVRKGEAHPLFQRLVEAGAAYPKWNFYKYLIDREGRLVEYYSSMTAPDSKRVTSAIEKLL